MTTKVHKKNDHELNFRIYHAYLDREDMIALSNELGILFSDVLDRVEKIEKDYLKYNHANGGMLTMDHIVPCLVGTDLKSDILFFLDHYDELRTNPTLYAKEEPRCHSCFSFNKPNGHSKICDLCMRRLGADDPFVKKVLGTE